MPHDLQSIYAKYLDPTADKAAAWTSFASQFLDQNDADAGNVAAIVVDEHTLSGRSSKLANLRLRLGDLLSSSARTGAALIGLGLSSLDPSIAVSLAVIQVLLFLRDVEKLQAVELTELDVKLLLWLSDHSSTWVDEGECIAQFGDVLAALRRLEALGCLSTEEGKWRVIEHVRVTINPDDDG